MTLAEKVFGAGGRGPFFQYLILCVLVSDALNPFTRWPLGVPYNATSPAIWKPLLHEAIPNSSGAGGDE